jgi:cytochrome oxidase Cu insertion factor (SCO1/SenC/PrrC family)
MIWRAKPRKLFRVRARHRAADREDAPAGPAAPVFSAGGTAVVTAPGRKAGLGGGRRLRWRPLVLAAAGTVAAAVALAACGPGDHGAGGPAAVVHGPNPPGLTGRAAKAVQGNPDVDPGTPLSKTPAPDFRLVNQFGQPVSLSQFRGKVVLLAFEDSQCTTVCPLTTTEMTEAKRLLGAAGDQVQLLGVDANPAATSVADVMAYSRAHGIVNQWDFLAGPKAQLAAVWKKYHIYAQIENGVVDHTPALYLIDQRGRERRLYMTQMAYASIGQQAQVLARQIAALLPGHPHVASSRSLAYSAISGLGPAQTITLPAIEPSGGHVTLGPGRPHLVVFFATWLTEVSDLKAELTGLNSYAAAARRDHLPALTAVDEAPTEPSPDAARDYLAHLGTPLAYPVAVDETGRVADGYQVQDQPWYVLTRSGMTLWTHDGWLPAATVVHDVQHAIAGR